MKPHIHQNIFGNWNGGFGRKKTIEFGTDEMAARDWLQQQLESQSPLSQDRFKFLVTILKNSILDNDIAWHISVTQIIRFHYPEHKFTDSELNYFFNLSLEEIFNRLGIKKV